MMLVRAGTNFHPGRNGRQHWEPFDEEKAHTIEIPDQWRETSSGGRRHSHDIAILIITKPIGRKLGWLPVTGNAQPPRVCKPTRQPSCRTSASDSLKTHGRTAQGAGRMLVNMAGYPDNQENGSMWSQICEMDRALYHKGDYAIHHCDGRGGDSGAPLWTYDRWVAEMTREQLASISAYVHSTWGR